MIFTTKNKELAIFGNTIDDIKNKIDKFNEIKIKNGLFGENGAFTSLFSGKKLNNILSSETLKQFDEFKEKFNSSSLSAEALAEQMENVDQRIIDYAKTCKNGEMTTEGFKSSVDNMSFSAKAGKVALQALATAGNMLAMWAISKGIELAVNWIDKLAHSSEYAEEAIKSATDSAKSFSDNIKNVQKETADMEQNISSIIDRYAELSQGINNFTNKNENLPLNEYEEFLELNKQLAGLFPSLTRNYDENGNAILGLSGSVDNVTESIRALVEQEKELARAKIRENIEQYFDGTDEVNGAWKALEGRKQELIETNEALIILKNTYEGLISADASMAVGRYHKNFIGKEQTKYIEYIKDNFGEDIANAMEDAVSIHLGKGLNGQFADLVVDFSNLELTETQKEQIVRSYDTFYSELLAKQKTAMSEFESQNSEFSNNAMLWLEDLSFYKDSNKYVQTAIQNLVRNIDWSNYDFEELDYDGVKRILQDSVLTPFQIACEDPTTKKSLDKALQDLFTIDTSDITVSDITTIDSYIDTIATAIEENPVELKIKLGFDYVIDPTKRLQNSIRQIADDHGIEDREQVAELNEVTKEFTLSEIELWLEATQGAKNATQATEMYKDALNKVKGETSNDLISPTLSSSINQIATQLEPQFSKLEEAYREIFTADGFTLNAVDNSMLENLRTAFTELEEEVGVTFDASVLNPFFDTLTNKSSTVEQVQDAFNNLATAYFYSTETLEHLTSETADAIEKQLEEMGVQNAAEVVADALTAKTEELIVAKEYLAQTGKELATATEDEQMAFILEQIEAGNCGEALALLQLKKLLVNSTQINTSADIQQIMNLASAAGMGAEVLTQLANAKSILSMVEAKGTDAVSLSSYEKALDDVESAKQTMLDWKPVELDFSNVGGGASKAGGAGKEAGDAYVDAFEEELKDLQGLRDRGVISEKEYLDRLRTLYQKYFKDKKKYAEQYAKYERQYLEGMKSLYDSALSGISKLMSSQIDGYNDAKEAAVSSLTEEKEARLAVIDAQKEQLEAEQDLIDEQIKEKQKIIDQIQDEIDAMKEAREERQRQLDLQKAQYELERMMHQRTILQYSEYKGMHYINDSSGARSAKEKVDDAKFEIEIAKKEKEIKLIEEQIDLLEEQKDAIQDQIDALDKQADSVEKYYSKMISEQEKYFDSLISNMEKQKSKWEEIAEIEEITKAYSAIEQAFGDMGYTVQDILTGNEQAFDDFKSKYISLMNDMNSNSSFAEGLSYATGIAEENLGSFLDKTKETADGISDLSTKGSELDTVAEGMGNLAGSATIANTNTGELATSMGELGTNTEGISDNLTTINDALNDLPETDNLDDLATKFTSLGEAIKSVADVLGIGEEGAVSTLVNALQEISTLSLDGFGGEEGEGSSGGGIITQFNNLKSAVSGVTNAISGGLSGGQEGDASGSSSPSMSSGVGGEGASGLISAIEEIKPATGEALGGGDDGEKSEGEGSGAIPQFQELKTAVDEVTAAIGTADLKGGGESVENTTLINALRAQYETASETLPETKSLFDELLESIMSCVGALNTMVSLIGFMADIGGFGGSGAIVTPHAKGTVGNAFANGTGNYKSLANREENALVSEYGQPEMTVLPDGKTILTNKPTLMDLPKGTVIFNEEQTKKIMDNKMDAGGNAYADGTDDSIWTTLADGTKVRPLQPGDKMYDLVQKFEAYFKNINGNIEKLVPNSYYEYNRQMDQMVNHISNVNNISNNNRPSVVIGDINVTCPGVTSQQVAEQLGGVLDIELDKRFNGFSLYTDQMSRRR